jgi:hypothetical protein
MHAGVDLSVYHRLANAPALPFVFSLRDVDKVLAPLNRIGAG